MFIDPPYNTGSAFAHYDDGVEHSLWLSLMRDRLEAIRTLLAKAGLCRSKDAYRRYIRL
ncbi:MAG: DNA methyltransferase [Methylococcales bacterium]